ncbi:MAG: hypothetical protein HYV27_01040 [Candidatus Hydrogenedentes bacterium]|nr:hypothetical protein [Candidatus Hydrogenedentota bacterium]
MMERYNGLSRLVATVLVLLLLMGCPSPGPDPDPVEGGTVSGTVKKHDSPVDYPLVNATVALVNALLVAESPGMTPLETLAASSLYTAQTNNDGEFTIEGVSAGSYFVHAFPSEVDAPTVLPGGDTSRTTIEIADAKATSVNVVLSQQPSTAARYVGSAVCLLCHDGVVATDVSDYKKTLHALVYRAPDQISSIQDLSDLPGANFAHIYFKNGNDSDNTSLEDEYGLHISRAEYPMFQLANETDNYDIWLGFEEDAAAYFMQFSSPDGTVFSERYYVDFTFGGHGLYKERWVTRVKSDGSYDADPAGNDSSYYILPIQYDENLQAGAEPFHPYNHGNWGPPSLNDGPAKAPAKNKSFDLNCAGCHFTGTSLTRDFNGLYHADAANTTDAAGIIDYDGDGRKDEMGIGCESCHGPGSEHVSEGNRPKLVLSRFLSAERDAMLCGRCHTRGVGKGVFTGSEDHVEFPSKGTDILEFPKPGIGYDEFAADFHTDNPGVYEDTPKHSRQHHQQFVDLQKSKHYKNEYLLMGCSECHNMHNRDIGPSLAKNNTTNELCMSCHAQWTFGLGENYSIQDEAEAVYQHMRTNGGMVSGYDPQNFAGIAIETATGGAGLCTSCHMPKTAASQSRFIHESVNDAGQPSGGRIRGDISSHIFDVITPAESQALFNSTTVNRQLPNSCGSCHNDLAGGIDFAYKSGE